MTIVHGDGTKSARIPLRRGLCQGCPLSPILGSFVVNALIRWIEDHGGGIHHPTGVETSVAAFCDDLTLTTEDVATMKDLFQRVYDYCQWAGVNINLSLGLNSTRGRSSTPPPSHLVTAAPNIFDRRNQYGTWVYAFDLHLTCRPSENTYSGKRNNGSNHFIGIPTTQDR
jgi:hypothetical protein